MSPLELVALLALTGYAIYRQTRVSEVTGQARFKLAIIYGVVGLLVGGFAVPHGAVAVAMLVISILLSVVVGLARGRLTRMWRTAQGQVVSQGTALTVGLFLGLVAAKFAMGTVAYFLHVSDGAGFGEILLMIGIMVAVQAQIVWQRAQALGATVEGSQPTTVTV